MKPTKRKKLIFFSHSNYRTDFGEIEAKMATIESITIEDTKIAHLSTDSNIPSNLTTELKASHLCILEEYEEEGDEIFSRKKFTMSEDEIVELKALEDKRQRAKFSQRLFHKTSTPDSESTIAIYEAFKEALGEEELERIRQDTIDAPPKAEGTQLVYSFRISSQDSKKYQMFVWGPADWRLFEF
jgi:hypothetical protein